MILLAKERKDIFIKLMNFKLIEKYLFVFYFYDFYQ